MKKRDAVCGGCLTGMISLVISVFAVTFISNYLHNAFHYKALDRIAAPNGGKYAHSFINTDKRESLAPYIGVSVSANSFLPKDHYSEVLTVSPDSALSTLELLWIDNYTLEIQFRIDPASQARIHYGKQNTGGLKEVIFTELSEKAEPANTLGPEEEKRL